MNSGTCRVIGIAGSLRSGSTNRGLLREAVRLAPAGMSIELLEIGDVPIFNEDVRLAGEPEAVREMKRAIASCDGLLFAVAEYNYSVSGVLKNAIDWASRPADASPLRNKPIAMMGAGGGLGTGRAQYHLRQIAVYTEMLAMNKPELMVSRAYERFDADGNLTDLTVRPRIAELLTAFRRWIEVVGRT